MNDCPSPYPYYKVTQNVDNNLIEYNECMANCETFFVLNTNTNINAQLCIPSCPYNNIYKYQIINTEDDTKIYAMKNVLLKQGIISI